MKHARRIAVLGTLTLLAAGCGGGSSGGGAAPSPPPILFGLDARPANTGCFAPPLGVAAVEIEFERVFANLTFRQPLGLLQAPGDDSRWFVVQREGRVRAFANDASVSAFAEPDFLSLETVVNTSTLESGLHGMAFHPDFASNGEVFLAWVEGEPPLARTVVARFRSLDGGLTLDPGTRQDVLLVNQDGLFHNGGHIAFGPEDGYLYIALGDGMYFNPGDQLDRARNTTNLLGAMLRIDVDAAPGSGVTYAIPPDNPFAGNPVCPADHTSTTDCPEIYAWGFRNPWKWSFDRATGALWLGDVGQHDFEEVNVVQRGGDYGWPCREGANDYPLAPASCALAADLIDPVHDYPHTRRFAAVTGGFVYRGSALPTLIGQYVFGDFMNGEVWRLYEDGQGGHISDELADTGFFISTFAEAIDGELYVVDYGGFPFPPAGAIYQIVPRTFDGPPQPSAPVPESLSETGCVNAFDPALPASGLIPFDVNAPAWFDGASRQRWFAIPDGTAIPIDGEDRFLLPERSVLMEHLRLDGRLIETRLLMHHAGGEWAGYSYEWNDTQTEARLVAGGKSAGIDGQQWIFPASGQCMSCHRASAEHSIGLSFAQLNRDFLYSATGRVANQLRTLDHIGLFVTPIPPPDVLPALADPDEVGAVLNDRARAWLHANCAHCHGTTPVAGLDLRHSTGLDQTGACNVAPQRGDVGVANALIIAVGEPDRSVLLARISRRDAHQMPPLATTVVDDAGVALIGGWISALESCL